MGELYRIDEGGHDVSVSEVYHLVYPYKRLNLAVQSDIVDVVERLLPIKEELENYSMFDSFDPVLYALRYLLENTDVDFSQISFVDCMSFCGAASFYASAFNIKSILGIEYYKQGYDKAKEIKQTCLPQVGSGSDVKFVQGSFQDYFDFSAEIVYLDCTQSACPDTMIDEGVLLHELFFPLCKKLLSGSFVVVVTSFVTLTSQDCLGWGIDWECMSHKAVDLQNSNYSKEFKARNPRHVWILKTSNYKHK